MSGITMWMMSILLQALEVETTPYVNFEDLAQKLPITLEREPNSDQSGEVYIIEFAGDPLALASQVLSDGDGNFKWWEVRSPEFENGFTWRFQGSR